MLPTVLLTEGATAAGIVALLPLPLGAALALLPIIGVALNGTSSVLYGTVPDLVNDSSSARALLASFTPARSAPARCPPLYTGCSAMRSVFPPAMLLVAAVVLLTLPLAWQLTRLLHRTRAERFADRK